jgi:RNA polymerase sigma factor (sigma-70 family)
MKLLASSHESISDAASTARKFEVEEKERTHAMSGEQQPFQWPGRIVRDQQLLARMKEDFDVGFSNVVEDYWRELCIRAYRTLEGSGLVYLSEDAVQEGFISAYKNLRHHPQKLDTLHLQHWLYAIVRQKAVECLTHECKCEHLADPLVWENEEEERAASRSADTNDDPVLHLECRETVEESRQTVTELLKSLPDAQRTAVVLKYLSPIDKPGEITYQQIAERLNKPVGTIKSDVSRAIHHMRKQLTKQHITGGDS